MAHMHGHGDLLTNSAQGGRVGEKFSVRLCLFMEPLDWGFTYINREFCLLYGQQGVEDSSSLLKNYTEIPFQILPKILIQTVVKVFKALMMMLILMMMMVLTSIFTEF